MGRVNSLRRLAYAASIGCDSIDGTQWVRYRDTYLATDCTPVPPAPNSGSQTPPIHEPRLPAPPATHPFPRRHSRVLAPVPNGGFAAGSAVKVGSMARAWRRAPDGAPLTAPARSAVWQRRSAGADCPTQGHTT